MRSSNSVRSDATRSVPNYSEIQHNPFSMQNVSVCRKNVFELRMPQHVYLWASGVQGSGRNIQEEVKTQ